MQTTKFKDAPTKGPLLKSQIVLYAISTLFSLWFLYDYGAALWRHRHDPVPARAEAPPGTFRGDMRMIWRFVFFNEPMRVPATQPTQPTQAAPGTATTSASVAPVATPAPIANPAAATSESLDSEVSRVVPTLDKWTPAVLDVGGLADYPTAKMADLEQWKSSTFARDAADGWRGMPDVPTLAGRYEVRQAAASNWPVPGSLAVEVVPTEGDPTGQAGPWRAVIFLAAPAKADEAILYRYLLNNYAAPGAREVILGRANVPAVPVAYERIGTTGRTFYCVVPAAQATVRVAATEVVQHIRPQIARVQSAPVQQPTPAPAAAAIPDPVATRYAAWKSLHDAYVTQVRGRLAAATSDEQKGQIQRDIATWQRANPEPPKPAAN